MTTSNTECPDFFRIIDPFFLFVLCSRYVIDLQRKIQLVLTMVGGRVVASCKSHMLLLLVALAWSARAQTEEGADASAAAAATDAPVATDGGSTNNDGTTIDATDSDYYFLEMRTSTLPAVKGWGVFAKADIPAGEILCEYRGPIIKNEQFYQSDKLYTISSVRNEMMKIVGNTLCAYINDCIDTSKLNYTKTDGNVVIHNHDPVPTFDNFPYNAGPMSTKLGKVFITSITNIPAGAEICYFYGW